MEELADLEGETETVELLVEDPVRERVGELLDVLEMEEDLVGERLELVDFVGKAVTDGLRLPEAERLTDAEREAVLEPVCDLEGMPETVVVLETDTELVAFKEGLGLRVAIELRVEVLVDVAVRVGKMGISASSLSRREGGSGIHGGGDGGLSP